MPAVSAATPPLPRARRSWWLANVSTDDAGRPPLSPANTSTFVHIVESWQPPAPGKAARTINVYSNAPAVRLSVNGAKVGSASVAPYTAATFGSVQCACVFSSPLQSGHVAHATTLLPPPQLHRRAGHDHCRRPRLDGLRGARDDVQVELGCARRARALH